MAIGLSNPNGSVGVSTQIDPVGANAFFAPGVVGGFHTTPTSPAGMKVNVGGSFSDSALIQSSTGVIYPLGNTDGSAIEVTIPAAPSTNKRIDSIVLYVDPTVTATATNGTDTCGIEVVSGTSAANPVPPTDAQIKAVVGAGSAYLVIANITVNSGATTITASNIAEVNRTDQITTAKIASKAVTAAKIDFTTLIAGPGNKESITNIAMANFPFTINLPNTAYGQVYYADTTITLPNWFAGMDVYAADLRTNLTTWTLLPESIYGVHSGGEVITIRAYRPQPATGTTTARLIVMGIKREV